MKLATWINLLSVTLAVSFMLLEIPLLTNPAREIYEGLGGSLPTFTEGIVEGSTYFIGVPIILLLAACWITTQPKGQQLSHFTHSFAGISMLTMLVLSIYTMLAVSLPFWSTFELVG